MLSSYNLHMRLVGHVFISALGGLFTFISVSMIVVAVQVKIHGDSAFEHDAGANFALFILAMVFAVPTAIAAAVLLFARLRHGRWLRR